MAWTASIWAMKCALGALPLLRFRRQSVQKPGMDGVGLQKLLEAGLGWGLRPQDIGPLNQPAA